MGDSNSQPQGAIELPKGYSITGSGKTWWAYKRSWTFADGWKDQPLRKSAYAVMSFQSESAAAEYARKHAAAGLRYDQPVKR